MFKTAYLLAYNTVCAIGWAVVLGTVSKTLYDSKDVDLAASNTTPYVTTLQMIACMELLHSIVGLVSGSPMSALMQLVGRNVIHFGFIVPNNTANLYVVSLYFAWSVAEVIRYPFYGLSIVDSCPGALLWLRYSAFILLYPIGILSEIAVCLSALSSTTGLDAYIGAGNLKFIVYPYLVYAYAIAAPKLIKYMLKARKKNLGEIDDDSNMKKKKKA
mmetsp:Transcript_13618/g.27859  ORF Transcript_13618/g.27859 Transcript_13618/m.27859 type:complete len:216 (-) Transcript_13618:86-733(-)|eukprot:CAMPEP_0118656712 /NCGR_PEP_ID=MMETSP0785-20121206/13629_1 /TAXON_ID=91992 /ORGANISM="Bolidomonas pacifica, Strain CCMP 1866" /LENGTH=215 /DNA_ID=CAMNT_0006549577 /DNA_START=95 /DNA_END=742 /DNA_ORIENTATION=+